MQSNKYVTVTPSLLLWPLLRDLVAALSTAGSSGEELRPREVALSSRSTRGGPPAAAGKMAPGAAIAPSLYTHFLTSRSIPRNLFGTTTARLAELYFSRRSAADVFNPGGGSETIVRWNDDEVELCKPTWECPEKTHRPAATYACHASQIRKSRMTPHRNRTPSLHGGRMITCRKVNRQIKHRSFGVPVVGRVPSCSVDDMISTPALLVSSQADFFFHPLESSPGIAVLGYSLPVNSSNPAHVFVSTVWWSSSGSSMISWTPFQHRFCPSFIFRRSNMAGPLPLQGRCLLQDVFDFMRIVPDDSAGRWVFSGFLPFPSPLHSCAASASLRFNVNRLLGKAHKFSHLLVRHPTRRRCQRRVEAYPQPVTPTKLNRIIYRAHQNEGERKTKQVESRKGVKGEEEGCGGVVGVDGRDRGLKMSSTDFSSSTHVSSVVIPFMNTTIKVTGREKLESNCEWTTMLGHAGCGEGGGGGVPAQLGRALYAVLRGTRPVWKGASVKGYRRVGGGRGMCISSGAGGRVGWLGVVRADKVALPHSGVKVTDMVVENPIHGMGKLPYDACISSAFSTAVWGDGRKKQYFNTLIFTGAAILCRGVMDSASAYLAASGALGFTRRAHAVEGGHVDVVVRLLATWVRLQLGSLPDFHTWESCRTIPPVDGFSRGSPISPLPFHSGAAPY
ncbi:hypothetical protein PR048_032456 [Dryococelus australis]|uniref:Uncharacterized protein n=1 Tax=Dryococelus australis TaxID=614101 RepID=A0ABQ9G6E5_9NEOP|nr:hypothetical protein PR048_032456 [Dryococelus australis]